MPSVQGTDRGCRDMVGEGRFRARDGTLPCRVSRIPCAHTGVVFLMVHAK